jgi:hypothetical protein
LILSVYRLLTSAIQLEFQEQTCHPVTAPMTFVSSKRTLLQFSLRSYGEEELALRVPGLSDAELSKIQEIARRHQTILGVPLKPKGPSDRLTRMLSKAKSMAAVEVIEGASRPLKRNRRRLKRCFNGRLGLVLAKKSACILLNIRSL